MDGPLTDDERPGSEGEGGGGGGLWTDYDTNTSVGEEKPPPMTRIARKKARSKRQRNETRAKDQEAEGTDLKGVVKKRRAESIQDAIQASYNLEEDADVVATGWTGKGSGNPSLENPILRELVEEDGMAYFSWDGR